VSGALATCSFFFQISRIFKEPYNDRISRPWILIFKFKEFEVHAISLGKVQKWLMSPSSSSEGIQVGICFLVAKEIGATMPHTVTQVPNIYWLYSQHIVIILLKRWKFCDVLYLVAAKDIQLSGGFHWYSNISRDYTTIGPHNHVTDLVRSNSSKIGSAILTASNAAHSLRQGAVMPWDGTTMSLQSGIKVETLPLNKRCLFKCNLSYFTLFRFQPPSIFRCFYHVTALTKPVSTLTGEWGWLVAKGVSSIKGCMDLCLKVSHF